MKCDKVIETFLKLDNRQSLPIILQVHLFRCSACRKFINTYESSLFQLRKTTYAKVDFSDEIMNKVHTLNLPESHVSNFKWILAGFFIIVGFASLPFSSYYQTLIDRFGINLELPLSIVMGCAITFYSAAFVMTRTSIFNSKTIEKFFGK